MNALRQLNVTSSIISGQVNSEVNLRFNPWLAKTRSKST